MSVSLKDGCTSYFLSKTITHQSCQSPSERLLPSLEGLATYLEEPLIVPVWVDPVQLPGQTVVLTEVEDVDHQEPQLLIGSGERDYSDEDEEFTDTRCFHWLTECHTILYNK